MSTVVYKVVVEGNENMFVSSAVIGMAEVTYQLNQWASAPDWLAEKGYHLLVFHNPSHAAAFASDGDTILVCTAENEVTPLPPMLLINLLGNGIAQDTWPGMSRGWPVGTAMYKRIKPVKVYSRRNR